MSEQLLFKTQVVPGTSQKTSENTQKGTSVTVYAQKGVIGAKNDVQKSKGSHRWPPKTRISSMDRLESFFLWSSTLELRHV